MKLVNVNGDVTGLGSYSITLKSLVENMHVQITDGRIFDTLLNFTLPEYFQRSAGKTVGFCAFEGSLAPSFWRSKAKNEDICFTFSSHNEAAFERKMYVLPPPVDLDTFRPRTPRDDDICRFLFIGQADERKGLDALMEAWNRGFADRDDVELMLHATMVEHSDEAPILKHVDFTEDKLPENVKQTSDLLTANELVELYQSCDVYVLPTRAEGWQQTTLEALACGLNVVVTNEPSTSVLSRIRGVRYIESERYSVLTAESQFEREWCDRNLSGYCDFDWWEPSVESLIAQMEGCTDKLTAVQSCTKAARRFDVKDVAVQLEKIL